MVNLIESTDITQETLVVGSKTGKIIMRLKLIILNLATLTSFSLSLAWAGAPLIDAKKYDSSLTLHIRYATKNNFTHQVVYPEARC